MRTRVSRVGMWSSCALLGLALVSASQAAQEQQASEGEIVIPAHWSPYQAPTRYPEGTRLHIIVRGDTLWDLSNRYFENPFLWPQLWDANRYIRNPHLIYPGDPLVIPDLDVLRAAEEGAEEGLREGELPGEEGVGPEGVAGPTGPRLIPLYEEVAIQCADYLLEDPEDENLRIVGSEEGDAKIALATGDVVYLNRGSEDGVSPGDRYYIQQRWRKVDHPRRFGSAGWHIVRKGWLNVLAVQEDSAIAEIGTTCKEVYANDYLLPFEPVPVPLVPEQEWVNRLTPETGNTRGYIVASMDDIDSLGQGSLVGLDVGAEDGVVPGNIFTIFRYVYAGVPRRVLGEVAVLTVQDTTATAKITLSYDFVVVGDQIELK